MGISFSPDQRLVIDTRNKNLLVSAAAGSGKTAVLVERIADLVCDDGIDIDRIVVLTFTKAAAGEMRERIGKAISERLDANPDDPHLQRQGSLIYNAQITTIDSFCQNILRNHYARIDLDPSFRVADEGEVRLLKKEALDELLEKWFAEKNPLFYELVEIFSGKGDEESLAAVIEKVSVFASSFPFPEEALRNFVKDSEFTITEGEEPLWYAFMAEDTRKTLEGLAAMAGAALMVCDAAMGPFMYSETVAAEAETFRSLSELDFSELRAHVAGVNFGRLSAKRSEDVDPELREQAKALRDRYKKGFEALKKRYFFLDHEALRDNAGFTAGCLKQLVELTLEYRSLVAEKKRNLSVITFDDMEHFALSILLEKDEMSGEYVPTQAAREYRDYYAEIMTDEYQDSNAVQEMILEAIATRKPGHFNRFMVGDVKQSIYRFRQARPEIFMEKYDSYKPDGEEEMLICLSKNFRSRSTVTDIVNKIFEACMTRDVGGIDYDTRARLFPGASYPEAALTEPELIILDTVENADKAREQEALVIAGRILKLFSEGYEVMDKNTGKMRPVRFSDITVISRSLFGFGGVLEKTLKQNGIPCIMSSSTGYFSATEIRFVMNFLMICDNPLQDIPLYGFVMAPVFDIDESEIALLRTRYPDVPLYKSILSFLDSEGDESLKNRLTAIVNYIEEYRKKAVYTPVRKLIRSLITKSGYMSYVTALPEGRRKAANLEMLIKKAEDYEKTSLKGLFNFIRYMNQLEKYEIDMGQAELVESGADAVRIMTIHGSKGLEFPVCIVAQAAKDFNMMDIRAPLLCEADFGLAMDITDTVRRIRSSCIRKTVFARKMTLDSVGEELRLLYVAMTRAREKLIITGTQKKTEEYIVKCRSAFDESTGRYTYGWISDSRNYLSYLMPVFSEESAGHILRILNADDLAAADFDSETEREVKRLRVLHPENEAENRELDDRIREKMTFAYPHDNLKNLYVKTTVTQLKQAASKLNTVEAAESEFEHKTKEKYVPDFIKEKDAGGTDRGNAYHKVMELMDFSGVSADRGVLRAFLSKLVAEKRLSPDYAGLVNDYRLECFMRSPLAGRMARAQAEGCIFREQPFMLGVEAASLGSNLPADEQLIIQGVIDVYWYEDGEIILADYKTDRVESAGQLAERYGLQLEYYAQALERLTGCRVKEKWLYSFGLGQEIRIDTQ